MAGGGTRAVRTRFAPSPNGPLHVGHARTAVFNWMLARQHAGRYFVRFERTDRPREVAGARASMVEDLEWLGLLGDEEPHDQVDLEDHHRAALDRLVDGGCTYAEGNAVRFKVPTEGSVTWDDLVRGRVEVANEDLDDPVLLRSSGAPTFFLASTGDDIQDRVSDLIRPDVLLRASAKQLHIWAALDQRPPRIGHHPLMKRPGGQNVTATGGDGCVRRLREAGVHPTALVAYLAMPRVASWKAAPVRLEDVIERFDRGEGPGGPWPSTSERSRSSIGDWLGADDSDPEQVHSRRAARRYVLDDRMAGAGYGAGIIWRFGRPTSPVSSLLAASL